MAKQNDKSGMTLADRDKKVLLILFSIILIALAWFLGYQKFNEKRMAVVEENQKLQREVTELRRKVSRRASIEEDTAKKQAAIDKVILHYPSEVRTQTVIERFDEMERKLRDLNVETEAFNMNQIFFQGGKVLETLLTQEAAQSEGQAGNAGSQNNNATQSNNSTQNNNAAQNNAAGNEMTAGNVQDTGTGVSVAYTGYRSDANITLTTDYGKLKKILNFLNGYSKRMNVREGNITSEEGTKPLKCTMLVSFYSVGGQEGNTYTEPEINGVDIKKDNIFK